jgi:hypothetical protein
LQPVAISGKSNRRGNGKKAKTVAGSCDQLPFGAVKEGVDFLAPQNAKSCEPEGPQDLTQRL